jgi:hypothetical protein
MLDMVKDGEIPFLSREGFVVDLISLQIKLQMGGA